MPTCSHCGAFCRNDAQFCSSCGAHFASPKESSERSEQAFNDYFSRLHDEGRTEESEVNRHTARKVTEQAASQPKEYSRVAEQASATAAAAAQVVHTAANQVFGDKVTYRDAMKKGWNDLRTMPNWIAKLFLLSLVNCVPILNFFVGGFVLRWGARASFGDRRTEMHIFEEGAFVLGFFAWIISLIWGIVLAIVGAIPIIGLVAIVFAAPFMQLAFMRLGMSREFGEAFEFSDMWRVYKENLGSLIALYWLPNLISIAVILVFSLVTFIGANIFVAISASSMVFFAIFFLFGIMLLLVFAFVCFVFIVGVQLVVARSFGHWIAASVPEWVDRAHACGGDRFN